MNPGRKATITLIATLILGVIIGYIGHSTWHRFQHKQRDMSSRPATFTQRLEQLLEPDSLHKDTVRAVLARHEERFKELRQQQHDTMAILMDSLIADLQDLVPEDRLEELERIRERGHIGRSRRRR